MAKKELKGNFQQRFAEGLLRVWSTLWLITELSNDKEPAIHLNLFFSYHIPAVLVEKNEIAGISIYISYDIYIYYVSSLYHNWHKKTKFILKLLGNL